MDFPISLCGIFLFYSADFFPPPPPCLVPPLSSSIFITLNIFNNLCHHPLLSSFIIIVIVIDNFHRDIIVPVLPCVSCLPTLFPPTSIIFFIPPWMLLENMNMCGSPLPFLSYLYQQHMAQQVTMFDQQIFRETTGVHDFGLNISRIC